MSKLLMLVGGVVFVLLVFGAISWRRSPSKPTVTTTPAAGATATQPAEAARAAISRPKTSQTFDIPEGGLRIWLEEAPAIYPKLGVIKITTPSGRVIKDTPGIDTYAPGAEPFEPAGWYIFHADPPGSTRKVEIYNRW